MTAAEVTARSSLCLVLGDPISHSLSPAMHNAGYRDAGVPFIMAASHVVPASLPDAIRGVRALGVRGLAVTMPHKVEICALLDHLDPVAAAIGAVNTVVNSGGVLTGHNTDWEGIVRPLERRTPLQGKRVAVLGAGGAAQAAAYGCFSRGASVAIFNRTAQRAHAVAKATGAEVLSLSDVGELKRFDIVINTTSIGMGEASGESPVPPGILASGQIIFETIYHPSSTALVKIAEQAGATAIRGIEMFLAQGLAQFELHTGVKGPHAAMEAVLRNALTP